MQLPKDTASDKIFLITVRIYTVALSFKTVAFIYHMIFLQ